MVGIGGRGDDGAAEARSGPSFLRVSARRPHSREPPAAPYQCFRDGRARRSAQGTGAPLQRHRASFSRSGVDDPDAHRRLLLRHPLGAEALPGGRPASGVSVVLQTRPRRRGSASFDRLPTVSAASTRAIYCVTSSSGWCGRPWRWDSSKARVSPSTRA